MADKNIKEKETKPYKSKYPEVNVELLAMSRKADAAGISYGKFVDKVNHSK